MLDGLLHFQAEVFAYSNILDINEDVIRPKRRVEVVGNPLGNLATIGAAVADENVWHGFIFNFPPLQIMSIRKKLCKPKSNNTPGFGGLSRQFVTPVAGRNTFA